MFFYIAAPPTEAPTMVTTIAVLSPPTLMSANRTSLGVLLQWVPPLEESPPLTSFVLQAKRGKGEWVTIDREIAINLTELIVQGLVKVNVWNIENMAACSLMLNLPIPFGLTGHLLFIYFHRTQTMSCVFCLAGTDWSVCPVTPLSSLLKVRLTQKCVFWLNIYISQAFLSPVWLGKTTVLINILEF